MTSPVTVSERDLRTLLGIVGDHCTDLPAAGLPLSLLAELKDQIPAMICRSSASIAPGKRPGSSRKFLPMPTTRPTKKRSGRTTGTLSPAVIPTAPATCAA
jgi:hypothetical protein